MRNGLLFSILLMSMPGCIVPTRISSSRDDFARRYVDTGRIDQFKPGHETRQSICAVLGPPPVQFNSEHLWIYTWIQTNEWRFALVTLYGSKEGDINREDDASYLLFQFDDQGVLRKKRIRHGGYLSGSATTVDDAFR